MARFRQALSAGARRLGISGLGSGGGVPGDEMLWAASDGMLWAAGDEMTWE